MTAAVIDIDHRLVFIYSISHLNGYREGCWCFGNA